MIGFLSSRYSFSSSERQRVRSLRVLFSIALSLAVVIVVMSIMEFLQNGRFEEIRDTRSFPVVVNGRYKEELEELFPEATIFEYGEGEALSSSGAFSLRYISSDYDGGLNYLWGDSSSLVIPYSLYYRNGPLLTLSILKKGKAATTMKSIDYTASGIYWTEVGSDFDSTMLFLPLEEADETTVSFVTALKNIDEEKASSILKENGYSFTLWNEAESSLYSAFLIEKIMMYLVLSLLFLIIMVSLKQSVRIFVSSREKEFSELEIIGMERKKISIVVILSFSIVLFLGIVFGLALGKILLIIIEIISEKSDSILTMRLKLSWSGFIFFSISLLLFTVISSLWENHKRERKELGEAVYGK